MAMEYMLNRTFKTYIKYFIKIQKYNKLILEIACYLLTAFPHKRAC